MLCAIVFLSIRLFYSLPTGIKKEEINLGRASGPTTIIPLSPDLFGSPQQINYLLLIMPDQEADILNNGTKYSVELRENNIVHVAYSGEVDKMQRGFWLGKERGSVILLNFEVRDKQTRIIKQDAFFHNEFTNGCIVISFDTFDQTSPRLGTIWLSYDVYP